MTPPPLHVRLVAGLGGVLAGELARLIRGGDARTPTPPGAAPHPTFGAGTPGEWVEVMRAAIADARAEGNDPLVAELEHRLRTAKGDDGRYLLEPPHR